MSLPEYDSSRNLGEPVELYLFRYGPDPSAYFAQTDYTMPVTLDGIVYQPTPLKRGTVTSSQSLDKSEMKISVDLTNPVAELFRLYAPSNVVTLVIKAGHADDPDKEFAAIWVGRIQQTKRDGRTAELSGIPDSISIRRAGLRRHYQLTCPHVLYDQGQFSCKANKAAATVFDAEITVVKYSSLDFAVGWPSGRALIQYVGGMVEWDGAAGRERRTILSAVSTRLKLNGPTTGLVAGDKVDIVAGCNHQVSDCSTLHNNIINFGGMPYIPGVNPVSSNPFN